MTTYVCTSHISRRYIDQPDDRLKVKQDLAISILKSLTEDQLEEIFDFKIQGWRHINNKSESELLRQMPGKKVTARLRV